MSSVVLPTVGEETSGTVASLDGSAFGQCLNGTSNVVSALELPRIFDDRIHVRWNSLLRVDGNGKVLDKLPCIVISPGALRPASERGTNRETAFWFYVTIAIHRAGGVDGINQMGDCLAALQEICVAFSKKPARSMGFEVSHDMLLQCDIDTAEADNERMRERGILVQFVRPGYLLRLPYGDVV